MVSPPTFSACRSGRREPLAGCQSPQSTRRSPPHWLGNQASIRVTPNTLARSGWADFVFSFHDDDEIGPRMLARIAKHTGLRPEDL